MSHRLTRREFVAAGAGAAGVLALGGFGVARLLDDSAGPTELVLRPQPETVELGGRAATTRKRSRTTFSCSAAAAAPASASGT